MNKRTVVMVVMDGWGVGTKDDTNPIYIKNPPNIDFIKHNYKSGVLQASGIAVGLPWDEEGNSEVGHLTLGAGRVLYQHYPRITIAVREGNFYKNEVLLNAIKKCKEAGTALNIAGVLSEGNVHASIEHVIALIRLAKNEGVAQLNFHVFTDGKDGPPTNGAKLLQRIINEAKLMEFGGLKIGALCGRYFGMDRDSHWDRTSKAFNALTGQSTIDIKQLTGSENPNATLNEMAVEYIEEQYKKGVTDEYIEPIIVDKNAVIKDGDSLIFFNYREDSIRQITECFLGIATEHGIPMPPQGINIATFTNYNEKYPLPVAFPTEAVTNPLGRVIADSGRVQLRVAETNKYAHVTYFFNGFLETPYPNEYRVLIPSQNVARHDEHPEMMANEITTRALQALSDNIYDFILINYANADIVAHTGNYNATLQAVQTVDDQIGKLMDAVLRINGVLVITADHGNAEKLLYADTGLPETSHDISPVPIYLVGKEFKTEKDDFDIAQSEKESAGLISDVAPTILEIMGLPQPPEMTGISLTKILQ